MRSFYFFFCILFLFSACKNDKELQIENKVFYQKTNLPCMEHKCTEAFINIPVVISPKNKISTNINDSLMKKVSEIVSFDKEEVGLKNYNLILESFIQSYDSIKKKYPEEATPWLAEINGKVILLTPKLLSIEIKHFVFSGGAHGYEGYESLNFDPENGRQYTTKELFSDLDAFSKLVENRLRTKLNIPKNKPINSTGLMFENNIFKLPENIFFFEDKIVAYYNIYEIASYSEGPLALVFTKEEVYPYLTFK